MHRDILIKQQGESPEHASQYGLLAGSNSVYREVESKEAGGKFWSLGIRRGGHVRRDDVGNVV